MTPVELALQQTRTHQTETLRELLGQHAGLIDQLQREYPGLCKNVSAGQSDMLKLLIELGFDINDRTDTKTALHHAAEGNDPDGASMLIAHGADPNLVDTHIGATPWGWANHFGNTETAAYLQPLTHHGDPLHEITVRFAQSERSLATRELVEDLLDRIHRQSPEPVLVRLRGKGASASIGLGRPDLSVALYLDVDNIPWHAVGDLMLALSGPVRFAGSDRQDGHDFYPTAAITVETARAIATEFILAPSTQPAGVTWEEDKLGQGLR